MNITPALERVSESVKGVYTMGLLRWIASLASDDVIDLYFIESDLKDIELNQDEQYQHRLYDALTMDKLTQGKKDNGTPIGKQVR